MDCRAIERDESERLNFQARVQSIYSPEMIVVVDEMGFNDKTANRKYGWAKRKEQERQRGRDKPEESNIL